MFRGVGNRGAGGLKFLEYYRFYKTKYLVDSFDIFLCPLAELVTLSSSMSLPYICQEILIKASMESVTSSAKG